MGKTIELSCLLIFIINFGKGLAFNRYDGVYFILSDVSNVLNELNSLTAAFRNQSQYEDLPWRIGYASGILKSEAYRFCDLGTHLRKENWFEIGHYKAFFDLFQKFYRLYDPIDLNSPSLPEFMREYEIYGVYAERIQSIYSSNIVYSLSLGTLDPNKGRKHLIASYSNNFQLKNTLNEFMDLLLNQTNGEGLLSKWILQPKCTLATYRFVENVNWILLAGLMPEEIYSGLIYSNKNFNDARPIGISRHLKKYEPISKFLSKILKLCDKKAAQQECTPTTQRGPAAQKIYQFVPESSSNSLSHHQGFVASALLTINFLIFIRI